MGVDKSGKTLFDFIENNSTKKFRKWALILIAFAIVIFFTGSFILIIIQSGLGKDVDWFGIKISENPNLSAIIEKTCEAQIPTRLAEHMTQVPSIINTCETTSPCIFPTATPTLEGKVFITPTPTLTVIPTITPTFPSEEFSNSCIPDEWKIYPTYVMVYNQITPQPCPTYQSIGLSGLNPGLQIIAHPTNTGQMTSGIYRKLPQGNFEIEVRFSKLTLTPPEFGRTSFYVMFFNSKDNDGKKPITKIKNSFYFSNDSPDHLPFLLFEKTPVAYSIESTDDILLTCEKQSQLVSCNLLGLEKTPILQEINFDPKWDSILVGYYSDQNGFVKVTISHFQIIPK